MAKGLSGEKILRALGAWDDYVAWRGNRSEGKKGEPGYRFFLRTSTGLRYKAAYDLAWETGKLPKAVEVSKEDNQELESQVADKKPNEDKEKAEKDKNFEYLKNELTNFAGQQEKKLTSDNYQEILMMYQNRYPDALMPKINDKEFGEWLKKAKKAEKETVDIKEEQAEAIIINEGDPQEENIAELSAEDMDEITPGDEPGLNVEEKEEEKEKEQDKYETKYMRVRSENSDTQDFNMDKIRLQAMYEIGHISKELLEKGQESPSQAIDAINQKMPLSGDKLKEYEQAFIEIAAKENLDMLPPSVLATIYNKLKDGYNKTKGDDIKNRLDAVAARIDTLIEQAAKKDSASASENDYFFEDVTNIADTFDGYMKMISAREGDLQEDSPTKQQAKIAKEKLEEDIARYDDMMNLKGENLNSETLLKRFEDLEKSLEGVELTPEHLEMLNSILFVDEKGNAEVQFIAENGNETSLYSEGCKIKPDSKLDKFVKLAKSQIIQEELGSDKTVKAVCTPERLQEQVSALMFGAAVVSGTEQGILEHLDEFTKDGKLDKEKLNSFVKKLSERKEELIINPTVFEKTVDGSVDAAAAYANRLGTKVGKDKAVVFKVLDSVKAVDKRADGRTTANASKRQVRIEMLKRTLKTGVSAFAVSGAISLAGSALSADAALTASTAGMNKLAGMGIGVALAVGTTAVQIHKWRKAKKAKGEPCGLRAMIKDRHLAPAIATTVCATTALGFAVTGNPGVATALGYASLGIGLTSGAVNAGIDAHNAGLSKLESAIWGVGIAGMGFVSGYMGRTAAQNAVNYWNETHPDNKIFQHEETKTTKVTEKEQITGYTDEAIKNAQGILDKWYADNPELLQERIASIEAYNAEHGTNINPQRYLLALHDACALSADNMSLHVQGGADVTSNANHKVFGEGWASKNGVDYNEIKAFANTVDGGNVNIDSKSIDLFNRLDQHIGSHNTVGHVNGAPVQTDHHLPENSSSVNGEMVVDKNGNSYTTYANGDSAFKTEVIERTIENSEKILVPNEFRGFLGMFGVLGNTFGKKLKERAGAFMDKIRGITGLKPDPDEQIKPKPKDSDEQKKPVKPKPKDTDEQIKPKPKDQDEPKKQVKPEPKEEKIPVLPLLLDEYKIVYGVDLRDNNGSLPEKNKAEYERYYGLVEKELKAEENPSRQKQDMNGYLQLRRDDLDEVACGGTENGNTYHDYIQNENADRARTKIVVETRVSLANSNLSQENRKNRTLSHFTKYLKFVKGKEEKKVDGLRNPDLNIDFKRNQEGMFVVSTDKLLFGNKNDKVSQYVEFKEGDSVLDKEWKVRQALDDLNGVTHNPKTNEVKNRADKLNKKAKETKEKVEEKHNSKLTNPKNSAKGINPDVTAAIMNSKVRRNK